MRPLAAALALLLIYSAPVYGAVPEYPPPPRPGPRVERPAPADVGYVACGALAALDALLEAIHVGDRATVRAALDRGCGVVSGELRASARLVRTRWDKIEVRQLPGGVEIFVYVGFTIDLEEASRGEPF